MEKYDVINVVGEGSYGLVMRCRHRESGQYVAIKKFLETEDDPTVRKMAIREIRMLKKLRHENLVNMLEVFRRKKRFFLVFEYLENTVLEELEARAGGLGFVTARKYIFQILRALDFIHSHNVIHRDIKPENVLVSRLGVIKLCDFGFARPYTENETFTDYVATRWYRSPELLVGDPRYGKEVDIWAVGCLYSEMMTGEPLFPGESDIDQLFQIVRVLGKLSPRHQALITQNSIFKGMKQERNTTLEEMFPDWNRDSLDFLVKCLKMDGDLRPDSTTLLKHDLFTRDDFIDNFLPELRAKINQESQSNPLLKRISTFGSENRSGEDRNKKNSSTGSNNNNSNNNNNNSTSINPGKEQLSQIGFPIHRRSFGNDEQLAPFRHYLNNAVAAATQQSSKSQIKQISINNLVFHENNSNTNSKIPRVLSAKLHKSQQLDKSQTSTQTHLETSSSPVQFQSLQPDLTLLMGQQSQHELHNQNNENINTLPSNGKLRISPFINPSVANQYFNSKKNLNTLGLQQHLTTTTQPKSNRSFPQNTQIPTRIQFPKTTRSNLLETNILPITTGTGFSTSSDISKDISPRILPPYPWLNTNMAKINQSILGNKTNLVKKNLNDWKSVIKETPTNDFLLPSCPGPSSSPYKGNKKKLSPMLTQNPQQEKTINENIIFPTPRNISTSSGHGNET